MSATTIIRFRFARSTSAPANRPKPKSVSGLDREDDPQRDARAGELQDEQRQAVTATMSPIDEIPWLIASRRKSRFRTERLGVRDAATGASVGIRPAILATCGDRGARIVSET